MKHLVLVAALMAAFSAQAFEVGVTGSYDNAKHDQTGYGVTVGEHFGKFSATAGFDRYSKDSLNKYSIIGGYDVAQIGSATLTAKIGAVYLDQENSKYYSDRSGYAGVVGAGVSIPVTKSVAATVDYRYQAGQSRVDNLNGSTVLVGAKYAF